MSLPPSPHLHSRLRALIITSPPTTALFYARIWHALVISSTASASAALARAQHDAVHALALAFLAADEPYSALHLVRDTAEGSGPGPSTIRTRFAVGREGCIGCAMLVARACEAVGRFGAGMRVLERAIKRGNVMQGSMVGDGALPTLQSTSAGSSNLLLARISHKANVTDVAAEHYSKALQADSWLWEAFIGLCELGEAPLPDHIFPSPPPIQPPIPSRSASTNTLRGGTMGSSASASAAPPMTLPMPRSSASEVPNLFGGAPRKAHSPLMYPSVIETPAGHDGADKGMFTPDVGSVLGGRAMGGIPARAPMLGGMMWDTPSTVGDSTFPSIDPPRRAIPLPTRAAPTAASTTTPAMEAAPARPPAMKRPRGTTRMNFETPVNAHGHSHGHGHSRSNSSEQEMLIRRNQRDLKSIEPNGDADLPPRRSSRLKSVTPATKPSRLPKPLGLDRDKRGLAPSLGHRSRSATATSSASTDLLSPPADAASGISTASASIAEAQLQQVADEYLRSVLRIFARATRFLCMFKATEALREIDTLPVELHSSAPALDIVARAFYESNEYPRSRRAFEALFALEPYRLQGVHIYSTLLWHVADAPALSALAQHVVGVDKGRVESWVALGNCFSLGKEHEVAMRCFKRAVAVGLDDGVRGGRGGGGGGGEAARNVAYAYTLCGYEAVEMEEYERAVGLYRSAISTDARLYNAWYGMGQVYLRMGKPRYAEHHFRRAAELNPSNPVLLCCIGSVLETLDDNRQALSIYEEAARVCPGNAMVAFRRVRMLVALGQVDDALSLLEPLSRTAPDEAQVQFLLGKCLLRVGRRAEAAQAMAEARELAPRLTGLITATIERNGEDVEEEEEGEE